MTVASRFFAMTVLACLACQNAQAQAPIKASTCATAADALRRAARDSSDAANRWRSSGDTGDPAEERFTADSARASLAIARAALVRAETACGVGDPPASGGGTEPGAAKR